ncbi:fatty acid hydroxylase family protein [Sphingomonas ginkgonis]|uniref:Fatty acid hydroxylase family protein n=1 Tax=Sphingomonas ginkgonis TaxID=2315330 RepID=A0A3R9YLR0_9SPHN|nr:sterol desaturase family protein [Sphingomonas ginkgonis]RST30600.1 fatty acid hydroxylase family protein [Sphingomonas ginkgonis]
MDSWAFGPVGEEVRMDFDAVMLLAIVASFFLFMGIEAVAPSGRSMPVIRHWRWVGMAAFALSLAGFVGIPLLVVPLLPPMAVVNLSGWGSVAFLPLWLLTTLINYGFHRFMHYFDWAWRAGHQFHHSAARLDIASAMMFHPVDTLMQGVLGGLLAAGLLHATPHAAAWAGLFGFWASLYQHLDVRTPAWTALLWQRPEAHMLHHERDVHARNYSDFPAWDRLFGTYAAPEERTIPLGFAPGRGRRWVAMLAMRDVNREADEKARISL